MLYNKSKYLGLLRTTATATKRTMVQPPPTEQDADELIEDSLGAMTQADHGGRASVAWCASSALLAGWSCRLGVLLAKERKKTHKNLTSQLI